MIDLLIDYGPKVLAWVVSGLSLLLGKYVFSRMKTGIANDMAQRFWKEIIDAVLEVSQVFSDGSLTNAQKKAKAIEIARANIGQKGLRRFARVVGIDVDSWIASKTEAAVKLLKTPPGAAPLSPSAASTTQPVPAVPLPPQPA